MADRLLALDIGKKRIGVAVSDPLKMFAIGLDTISRYPENKSIENIVLLCQQYKVSKIIAGFPLNMKGQEGVQTEDVHEYIGLLQQSTEIVIELQDERLTSVLAQKILIEQKISPSRNKGLIDKKAAELILQQYMDTIKSSERGEYE
jgi:putative Holliday junction resolvase